MRAVVVAVALGLIGACVESKSVQCGDVTCPQDFVCTGASICASQESLAACMDQADGASCNADGASGQCVDGTCITIVCGNGRLDPGEVCDDGNLEYGDNCNPTCQSELFCGNGYVDPGELCDCGDSQPGHSNATCTSPNGDASTATCRPDCTPHGCGDGVRENSEQCDGAALGSATCETLGFYAGTLECNNVCQFETTGCSLFCGDSIVNGPSGLEACDGAPPPGESCTDYGFDAGALGCSNTLCRPTFDACKKIGWEEFAGDSRGFYAVWGSGPDDVWGGGSGGGLLHWNGATWSPASIAGSNISGIWGSAKNDVYLLVDDKVYHYDGTAWTLHTTLPFQGAAISGSGSRVIVVGQNGAIHSYDGSAWAPMTSGTTYELNSVHVISPTLAYAGGGDDENGVLLKWNGATWSPEAFPPSVGIVAIWGRSASDLYVGDYYALMHWNGTNWSTISLGFRGGPTSISGTATDVFVTFDVNEDVIGQFDGTAWTLHQPGLTRAPSRVWASPDGTAFCAGLRMARYVGSAWTKAQPETRVALHAGGGTPTGVTFVVGENGFALRRDWGTGAAIAGFWRRLPTNVTKTLLGVSRDIAVGEGGTIATFDGTRLNAKVSNTTERLWSVWANSSTDAWAVGDNGVIVHFDGTTGTVVPSGTTNMLRGVFGFSSTEVYAVGDGGTVIRWNGTDWQPFPTPVGTSAPLLGIWGGASNNLFVVGVAGTARRWNGSSWIDLSPPTTDAILSVGFTPFTPTDLYFADGGPLLIFHQANNQWERVTTTTGVRAVSGRGAEFYAFGDSFTFYRRENVNPPVWRKQLPIISEPVTSIYAVTPNDVYATTRAQLLHFDGYLWSQVTTGVTEPNIAVAGTGASDIWVVSDAYAWQRWDGAGWTYGQTGIVGHDALAIGTANRPFAFRNDGAVRRFDGSTWQNADTGSAVAAAWAASDTSVFAVGPNGTALQWNGAAWSPIPNSPISGTTGLRAVFGLSATDVWIAGDGVIARRHNGSWDPPHAFLGTIVDLFGQAADDMFAVGLGGLIMYYDGQAWSPFEVQTTQNVESVGGAGKMTWFGTETIRGLRRDLPW